MFRHMSRLINVSIICERPLNPARNARYFSPDAAVQFHDLADEGTRCKNGQQLAKARRTIATARASAGECYYGHLTGPTISGATESPKYPCESRRPAGETIPSSIVSNPSRAAQSRKSREAEVRALRSAVVHGHFTTVVGTKCV